MYLKTHLVALLAVFASSQAYPTLFYSPVGAPALVAAPVPVPLKSQYHAQDELGQYTYGYTDGLSSKAEAKTFDGVTRGGYSYLDSNGVVQNVNYVSDALGFRVAASNLPVAPVPPPAALPAAPLPVEDTPEVAAAKQAHLVALKQEEIKAAEAPAETEAPASEEPTAAPAPVEAAEPAPAPAEPKEEAPAPIPAIIPPPAALPLPLAPAPIVYAAPAPVIAAPAPIIAAPAPVIAGPLTSQYHSQDELGQYSYGYAGGPSAKSEIKTFDGVTRGGYSYVDANGLVQSAQYVSDPLNGFRVAASNLPVAPVPVDIPDSPEVAAVKAKHLDLVAKAAAEAAAKPE